jgi:drug/metabolite transporter (DMT)-like permease
MTAVLLGALSAIFFGAMSVTLRIGLRKNPDVELAGVTTLVVAFLFSLVWVAIEAPFRGLHLGGAWPFVLAGLIAPGGAQLFITRAVHDVGASRTSVVMGTAPLVAVTLAIIFLGERPGPGILVAAVMIVAGGFVLAGERGRPDHLRALGLLFAFIAATLFSIRDNVLRWLVSGGTHVPPAVAVAAAVGGGVILILAVWGPRLGGSRPSAALAFVPVGLCFGSSYVAMFEAFYRGGVSIVNPLVATESMWGVLLSVLLLRSSEFVGRRLVIGALLVVGGGVLIGVFR